jgi:DNA-binding NarL/FixJ family response regulator
MVLIDDAHILDDASAAFMQMLATTDGVFVVMTVRTGEPAGNTVTGLVKDGLAERIELQALSQAETEHLVDLVLPGHVDGVAKHHLWTLSRGNALYLKELLVSSLAEGTLLREAEVWRWRGSPVASHLMELVGSSIGRLKPEERRVLEVLAIGEPLGQTELYRCAEPSAIDAVERRGLVEFVKDNRRRLVRLSHPLYTEAVKATANPHRDQQIGRDLADALEATRARRREDVLRIAKWRLDAAAPSSPDVLCSAAIVAMSALDDALAERLSRAAIESGGGLKPQMLLAVALTRQQRGVEAETLLASLEAGVETDEERARIAELRAFNLFILGSEEKGLGVLRQAESAISDPGWLDWLLGLRAEFFVATGRHPAAIEAAEDVLRRHDRDSPLAIRAIIAIVPALAINGRGEDAVQVADRAIPTALRVADQIPVTFGSEGGSLAAVQLRATRFLGLRVSGRFEEMATDAKDGYADSLQILHGGPRVLWAGACGQAALDNGRVRTAVAWLREGAALAQQDFRDMHLLALWLANLAKALAWLNETKEARQKLTAATFALHPAVRLHDAEVDIATAWVLAAEGDVSAARSRCFEAAQRFGQMGQHFFEVILLHDLVRLGAPQKASARLAELAGTVQGQFAKVCARHALAATVMDGAALEDVSEGFRHMGGYLLAAEAEAQAAHAYRRAGRAEKSRAAAQRSERLAEHCEGARTPILAAAEKALPLTDREREVATLAAHGLTSRAIAQRLSVSVRTVENHLQICYSKLGISGRGELSGILEI